MTRRFSLWLKILLVAFLNIFFLLTVFFVIGRLQFRLDLGSFLLAPARDRMISVSHLVAMELPNVPRERWNVLLAQYSATYPADLFLFDRDGTELAGKQVQPPRVYSRVDRHLPTKKLDITGRLGRRFRQSTSNIRRIQITTGPLFTCQ